jgi:hypothetical protein
VQQCIQLTSTNRPCDLTLIYFPPVVNERLKNLFFNGMIFYGKLGFPAAMPKGQHPFPFRTRKLSSSGPMIL